MRNGTYCSIAVSPLTLIIRILATVCNHKTLSARYNAFQSIISGVDSVSSRTEDPETIDMYTWIVEHVPAQMAQGCGSLNKQDGIVLGKMYEKQQMPASRSTLPST